jgi:hypothetical protein
MMYFHCIVPGSISFHVPFQFHTKGGRSSTCLEYLVVLLPIALEMCVKGLITAIHFLAFGTFFFMDLANIPRSLLFLIGLG